MVKCKKCEELISILKEVKFLMDSENYHLSFDNIYDKISAAVEE